MQLGKNLSGSIFVFFTPEFSILFGSYKTSLMIGENAMVTPLGQESVYRDPLTHMFSFDKPRSLTQNVKKKAK